jgi:ubiquinone biosynthesis protein
VPRDLMLLFKAIFNIESLGKQLEPTFDILQIGQQLAREALTIRYNRERITRDIIHLAREIQGAIEPMPRTVRGFIRQWTQNGYAFETRNRDIAALSGSVRHFARVFALSSLAIGLFALSITFLILEKGPSLFGLPLAVWLTVSGAFWAIGYALWTSRK